MEEVSRRFDYFRASQFAALTSSPLRGQLSNFSISLSGICSINLFRTVYNSIRPAVMSSKNEAMDIDVSVEQKFLICKL